MSLDASTLISGRELLVVDDNDTNLVAIEAALAPLGRPIVSARSGNEALGELLKRDFALILLDVAMPGIDGFETARLIRARERSHATPIIFLTGVAWEGNSMLRGYDLGAFDYLMKPIRPEVLRAKAQVFIDLQDRTHQLHQAQLVAHQRELDALRQRMETDALERQMKQLVDVDRRKDEFLAILGHELRNPLQPLLSAVEMIDAAPHDPLPDRTRQMLRRQIGHVKRLVDDLLDISRFASGKLELRREIVAIDHIIDEAVLQCQRTIEDEMHDLTVRHAGEQALLDGDPVRLVQVVSNLLANATRYTPSGGQIEISAHLDGDEVSVRVVDTGRGISPAVLPRIFELFVQERAGTDGAGGLGLGLGIVKRLVEMHGGRVHATSDGEGKGSTFEAWFPLAEQADAARLWEGAAAISPAIALRPMYTLICDDAEDLREMVADLLRAQGHRVTTVADGLAALHAILHDKPDVAIIDIGLPGMNGYEVARSVRETLSKEHLRLVAMTGFGQEGDRAAAFEAGFDAHITKPATLEALLGAMIDDPVT